MIAEAYVPFWFNFHYYLYIYIFYHKWAEDQLDATESAGESLIPNPDTTEVSQTPKSESMISAARKLMLKTSLSLFTSSPSKSNKFHPKPWKPHVLPATNILPSTLEKTTSTFVAVSTPGTSCVLTRCYHVLEQIDSRQVWEVLSEKVTEKPQELESAQSYTRLESEKPISRKLFKPSEEPRTNSPEDRKSLSLTSGDSHPWLVWSTKRSCLKDY